MAKTKKKSEKKSEEPKSSHYVHFVENCTPGLKKFNSEKAAIAFVRKFQKENPHPADGYWVDFLISDVRGNTIFFDDYWFQ
jgi:hypothetical protein